jgi:outer membrane protein TolC
MSIRARALWPLLALVVASGPLSRSALAQKPPTLPAASAPAPATAISSTWASVPAPAVSDPMLEPPPPPTKIVPGWRDALALVKARSVDLQVAVADVVRAEAQSRLALASLYPSLTGSANATQQLIRASINQLTGAPTTQLLPPRATTYGAGLSFSMPIVNARSWYALDTAELNVRVAQMTIAEQRRLLAAGVANALVNVVTTERIADLNRVGLRNSLERLVLTKRRADLGVANALDVLRLEQDVASARSTIVSGDENLRQAREALGLAIGVAEPYGVPQEMNLDTFARESEQACRKINSLDERSDIAVANERITLARRGIEDVRRQYYPTLDLRSSYSLTLQPFYAVLPGSLTGGGATQDTIIDRTNTIQAWSVAAVLSWNIYDGGARAASGRDVEAQVTQAELRAEQVKRQATVEVSRAGRAIQVADDSRKVAVAARDLAREAERLTRVSFDLGKGTSLELVDAGRQLRQAEIQLVLQEFNLLQARITALLAMSSCEY